MLNMRKEFCRLEFWTSKKIYITQDLSRKNYLSKTVKPFYGIIDDDGKKIFLFIISPHFSNFTDDEHLPPLSTIEQRSLAILQDLPFLISFNTRVLLLRELCRNSLGNEMQRMRMEFAVDNVIVIRRTHLYEDAFEKLSQQNGMKQIWQEFI